MLGGLRVCLFVLVIVYFYLLICLLGWLLSRVVGWFGCLFGCLCCLVGFAFLGVCLWMNLYYCPLGLISVKVCFVFGWVWFGFGFGLFIMFVD